MITSITILPVARPHVWQKAHFVPMEQPDGFQLQAQGLRAGRRGSGFWIPHWLFVLASFAPACPPNARGRGSASAAYSRCRGGAAALLDSTSGLRSRG